MLALANNPPSVQKAIIAAFSFGLTAEMKTLIDEISHLLHTGEMHAFSNLVNTTLGEFLPDRIKETNKKYLAALTDEEIAYLKRHFEQALAINKSEAINIISNINVPTLFINGSKDKYTSCNSVDEACIHIKHSTKMELDCGHFMPMENKGIATQLKGIVSNYFN